MDEFVNGISQFEIHNENATLEDYLQDVSLISDIDQYSDKSNSVVLMTLHSAKGLEFPQVFISGLEDGLFPLERAKANESELEEERRLFYVGITRAMKKVYLSSARQRMKFGLDQLQSPSSFLDELPEDCVEIQRPNPFRQRTLQEPAPINKTFNSVYSLKTSDQNTPRFPIKNSEIKKGSWVLHKIFGKGKVLSIQQSSTKIYRISFSGGVVKSIAAKFVKAV